MSITEELTFGGHTYATREAAAAARREAEANQRRAEEARAKRAADAERRIRDRFMATPGATDEAWQLERAGILAEARRKAALSGDDAARRQHAEIYGGF